MKKANVNGVIPGPASYNIKPLFGNESPKKSIHLKTKSHIQEEAKEPGPGNYNPDPLKVQKADPAYTMGRKPKQDALLKQLTQLPAPGSYNPNFDAAKAD